MERSSEDDEEGAATTGFCASITTGFGVSTTTGFGVSTRTGFGVSTTTGFGASTFFIGAGVDCMYSEKKEPKSMLKSSPLVDEEGATTGFGVSIFFSTTLGAGAGTDFVGVAGLTGAGAASDALFTIAGVVVVVSTFLPFCTRTACNFASSASSSCFFSASFAFSISVVEAGGGGGDFVAFLFPSTGADKPPVEGVAGAGAATTTGVDAFFLASSAFLAFSASLFALAAEASKVGFGADGVDIFGMDGILNAAAAGFLASTAGDGAGATGAGVSVVTGFGCAASGFFFNCALTRAILSFSDSRSCPIELDCACFLASAFA